MLGEQTCGDHDPALPLPSFSHGMAAGGLAELPLVLLQGGLFMADGQSMKDLVSRADCIGYSDTVYHCKPRGGVGEVITIYYKPVLTD